MAEAIKDRRPWIGIWPMLTVVVLFGFEMIALCWPALINRGPLMFVDTRGYYVGGRAALDKASAMLTRTSGGDADNLMQQARGVRSAFYSLFVYITTTIGTLNFPIIVQAAMVALMLSLLFRLVCPGRNHWQAASFVIVVALVSTVSWTTSMVMPDIFTPILALSMIVLVMFWDRISLATRWTLIVGVTASVVMHLTNLPLAIVLLVVLAILRFRRLRFERTRYALIGGALGVGALAMLTVGVVGFHQWSLSPQAPPFLLARSIQDGPGRLYLQDHCPQIGLAMCRHLDRISPASTDDFIWHDNGVYSTVSAEERAELRAEEKRIFVAAALEHPWMQATAMAQNALHQLVLFNFREYIIPSSAEVTPTEMTITADDPSITLPVWQVIGSIPIYLVVIASLWYAMRAWRQRWLDAEVKQLVVLVIATALIAAAAGALSEPAPRYEARVIWLIPMVALLCFHRRPEVVMR